MAGYPGRQGRKPKPTALKVMQGTARPDRTNAAEPKPRAALPSCPRWLTPLARAEWRRVVREMGPTGVITAADGSMLALYCALWANVQTALQDGRRVQAADIAQLRALASAFGLDPSSRSRIHAAPPVDEDDPFEKFLAEVQGRR